MHATAMKHTESGGCAANGLLFVFNTGFGGSGGGDCLSGDFFVGEEEEELDNGDKSELIL